jgi:hypothetical protein
MAVDRGEGHPANRATEVRGRWPKPPNPAGLHDLAVALGQARRNLPADRPGRLVLRCSGLVLAVLTIQQPEPGFVPSPRVATGTGLSYRQVEIEPDQGRDTGWTLLDDGEIIAEGEL